MATFSSAWMHRLKPRSIVLRLALGIGTSIFLLATGTGIFLYLSVRNTINTAVYKDLEDATKAALHRLVEEGVQPDKEITELGDHLSVRVTDRGGRILIESSEMGRLAPISVYPIPGNPWVVQEGKKALGHHFKLVVVGYPEGWIQIVRNDETERALIRSFRMSLYLVLGVVPVLAALIGLILAKRGLGPVENLAQQMGTIQPETLGLRFESAHLPKELVPLAEGMNGALSRLETAFARLGELNSDLAHELRTPVHVLRLEMEEIVLHGGATPEYLDRMEGMMETLQHLSDVIEQMLFLARTEDPSNQIALVPLDARSILVGAAEDCAPLAEEKQVPIQVEASNPMTLVGDSILLRRALHNLLSNAIRHTPSGKRIRLRAREIDGTVSLEVEDQGEGIPAELLPLLGRRFIRQDRSRSRNTGGAGLGLAIVQSIAWLHKGRLEIESQVGQGTIVRMHFPRS